MATRRNGRATHVFSGEPAEHPWQEKVPPYVFEDAVVMVRGERQVVKKIRTGAGFSGTAIMLTFKNGKEVFFDEASVTPPEGALPKFLSRKNAKVELKAHTQDNRDNGIWSVRDRYFSQKEGDAAPTLHLDLRRRKIAKGFNTSLQTRFNAATIRKVGDFVPQPVKLLKKIVLIRKDP